MTAKCPRCGNHSAQGTDYAALLERAEAGRLELLCARCGRSWEPPPEEQGAIERNLRNLIASRQGDS